VKLFEFDGMPISNLKKQGFQFPKLLRDYGQQLKSFYKNILNGNLRNVTPTIMA
jgi:hypothetical protein